MRPAAPRSIHVVDFAARRATRPAQAPTAARVPRVARLLALAHRVDAMIRTGELRDLADAARVCGITRPRMSQVASLQLLAPAIQDEILALEVTAGRDPVTERSLRPIVAEPDWDKQLRLWRARGKR